MRSTILRFAILLVASYGMLYFSQKYYVPIQGDFGNYYPMYEKPLDFTVTSAPFIYRQMSAIATHALYTIGIYYPNEIAFNDPAINQRLFFAALLTNYLGLLFAAVIAGRITERETGNFVFPLLAGMFCMLSFHAQSVVITGLTEGMAWMFFAALYLLYVQENRVVFASLLALAIFQRETIPVAFGMIALFSLLIGHGAKRYNLFVLVCSTVSFLLYVLVRLYAIPVPGYESQLSITRLLENLVSPQTNSLGDLIFQVFLSQNVAFIAIGAGVALWVRTRVLPRDLLVLLLTFVALTFMALAQDLGNDVGRIAGILSPGFAAVAATSFFRYDRFVSPSITSR